MSAVLAEDVDLYHNIRWARYKARVFSALYTINESHPGKVRFHQIADTDRHRVALSGVEIGDHRYPHELIFAGPYESIPKLRLFFTLVCRVARSNARLILIPSFDRPEYWGMLAAAMVTGKRRAVFCDSTLLDRPQVPLKGLLKRVFFHFCDGFFCYGERARDFLLHYGANPKKIYQRFQAAALPDSYTPEDAAADRLISFNPESVRFLYVGRLSKEKSLHVLLRAFAKVATTHEGARLILVGGGPEREALEALTRTLDIGSSVEFAGPKDLEALVQEYARATCLVLPSETEPWGLVVNEALHYCCPVVVSRNCGCVPELVLDDITGYSFRTGDVEDLAEKLTKSVQSFKDTTEVSRRCLGVVGRFVPPVSAQQIIDGCAAILNKSY